MSIGGLRSLGFAICFAAGGALFPACLGDFREPAPGDASSPRDAGPADLAELVCTSGKTWSGNQGMGMRPGSDCGACHGGEAMRAGAAIAGTIYPSLHERENCWGTPERPSPPDAEPAATVEITGANGVVLRVPVSYAGNFLAPFEDLGASYTARVSADGHTREMLTPQSNPSCNACHSDQGANGAPGRILTP